MWLSSRRILIITTYYEIPTQLACAYLKGHLTGRELDWFEVLGYRVKEDNATDYAHLKQSLTEQLVPRGIGRKIGGRREVTTDNLTIADRRGNSTDLRVKVLRIIGDSRVDAEVVNRIIDSIIKAVDRVVRETVLSGFRMIKTDI
ncbi:uncharacterized protein TNCV_1356081 [Trichonephila clavipes]|uniref:Uncharacterized protein n=1 Tax=Trichonephila clavipes TaxID=2585209 RepID=A0A8X6VJE7_TRICX|nr:uncharacterized protein TNCV_1356081 [Trichonephila clavipes]